MGELNCKKQMRLSIGLIVASIFVELIACILWLIPMAGFFIYPFVSGFAAGVNIISFILSSNRKKVRTISCVICIVLILTIIVDVIFCVKLVRGF